MRRESDVLSSVLSLLKARGVFGIRMNTGGMYSGKRFVRFGSPGMADVLALLPHSVPMPFTPVRCRVLWIECKSSTGKQSRDQRVFQQIVEREGHTYLLVRSAEEVNSWLEAHRG